MLFHPVLFAFFLTVSKKGNGKIYTQGTIHALYHPTGYASISVSFVEQIHKAHTKQVSPPSFSAW